MTELLNQFWHVMLTIAGGIVWLVRLEARTLQNAKDTREASEEIRRLESRLIEQRREDREEQRQAVDLIKEIMRETRAEIKEDFKDLRKDIWELLAKG